MNEAVDAVAAGRTLIVIAHRLSTVVDSDLIVVMENGRVVGSGTHSELVQSTPLYRDLANTSKPVNHGVTKFVERPWYPMQAWAQ